jgi:LDH2 family malate/lactate/ureidoglycolate dehydrogenase
VDATVEGIKALPAAEGFGEVMVPGEPEDRVYAERLQKGVPLPEGTINNLRAVADKLGLAQPAWLAA